MKMMICKDKRCKTCPSVDMDMFDKCNFKVTKPICKTSGVIYMITCGHCNIKYIGQTGSPLHLRINNHRSLCNKVKNNNTDIQSKYEFEHFKMHSFKQAKISILDIIDDDNNRIELENYYIIKYKTVYPYGLNDRVNNISVTAVKDSFCIYKEIFSNITDNVQPIRMRSQNKRNLFIDFNMFINDIDEAILSKSNIVGYVKGKILGLKRSKAKVFTKFVKEFKFRYYLIQDLIYDLLKFKLNIQDILADTNNFRFNSYLVIDFKHKYMDTL